MLDFKFLSNYTFFMLDLIKNVGLGLFVNGLFALMNFDFRLQSFIITILSVVIMCSCIILQNNKDRK